MSGRDARADGDDWVVVQIGRVQVEPTRKNHMPWDTRSDKAPDCGLAGVLGGVVGTAVAGPVGGKVGGAFGTLLCSSSGPTHTKGNPTAPDLLVVVKADTARYFSPLALDTIDEVFDYKVLVPLGGLPATGLDIEVRDADSTGAGDLIGRVRLSRQELEEAREERPPEIKRTNVDQISEIEIEVLPYEYPPNVAGTFQVNQAPLALGGNLRAGEFMTIQASGTYSVANNHEQINEQGYTNGAKRGYSLYPTAPHGSAIAWIGDKSKALTWLGVGSCSGLVSPTTGPIYVGVNDKDVGNNIGSIKFEARIEPPTVAQWLAGGASYPCAERKRATDNRD